MRRTLQRVEKLTSCRIGCPEVFEKLTAMQARLSRDIWKAHSHAGYTVPDIFVKPWPCKIGRVKDDGKVHSHVSLHVHIWVYMNWIMNVCKNAWIWICGCVWVCLYVCLYIRRFVCMYARAFAYVCIELFSWCAHQLERRAYQGHGLPTRRKWYAPPR